MILITNDDGITAPGIKALVEAAAGFDEIMVVAPDSPQSAKGHAITINAPLYIRKSKQFDGINAYECSGTPADCVKLAKNVLAKDKKIKLCISGINHGSNASINIIYSGTMSAAMEASLEGIPAIGFSLLDYNFDADFSAAKEYARLIIGTLLNHESYGASLLNVNIPALPLADIKGIKICRQGKGVWEENFQENKDPRGQSYYWLTGTFQSHEANHNDLHVDINALDHGYVSIVPSHHDLTQYEHLSHFSMLENQKP